MDAFPLAVNQQQLKLMQDSLSQEIAALQDKDQANQFASGDGQKKEQNVLTYGTDDYQEVHALAQDIEDQLKSHLDSWQGAPADTQPVSIALNSYQLRVLRDGIEHELGRVDDPDAKHQLESVLEQLPELNLQEQSD